MSQLRSLIANLEFSWRYVWAETKRRRRSFFIGLSTVFLVVFFLSLLQEAVSKSPVIFFKLSEEQAGENDLVLLPYAVDQAASDLPDTIPLLNHTEIAQSLQAENMVSGTAPRWLLKARVSNPNLNEETHAYLLGVNSSLEEEIGIGRDFEPKPLEDFECYISRSVVRQIGMNLSEAIGKTVRVSIDISFLFGLIGFGNGDESFLQNFMEVNGLLEPGAWDTPLLPLINTSESESESTNLTTAELANLLEPLFNDSVRPEVWDILRSSSALSSTRLVFSPSENALLVSNPNSGAEQETEAEEEEEEEEDPLEVVSPTFGDLIEIAFNDIANSFTDNLSFEAKISAVVDAPKGKWPTILGNVIVMDAKEGQRIVKNLLLMIAFGLNSDLLTPQNMASFQQFAQRFDINEFAFSSIVMFSDRFKSYVKTEKELDKDMIGFTDAIAEYLGVTYPAVFTLPIVEAMEVTYFIRLFVDNIFFAVVFLLSLLGVMLIYALLISDVEQCTYEYGMLRALGMKHKLLIQILLSKSILFALPGIILGLLVSSLMNIYVTKQVSNFAGFEVSPLLSFGSISLSIAIGLLMPLISNVIPIQRALSKTLRDSLDVYHHVISETSVRIMKLTALGLQPWEFIFAITLITIGFISFYLIPFSFIMRNFALFLGILMSILIGMLIGLTIVTSILHFWLHKLIARFLVRSHHLKNVVLKNMDGHVSRNSKTAQMFITCLAFIIFAGALVSLQTGSLIDNVKVTVGSDVQLHSTSRLHSLDEVAMSDYLNDQKQGVRSPSVANVVDDFTFVTYTLDTTTSGVAYSSIAALAGTPEFERVLIYGIEENFLKVAYSDYLMIETDPKIKYPKVTKGSEIDDPVAMLYDDNGVTEPSSGSSEVYIPPVVIHGELPSTFVQHRDSTEEMLHSSYTQYLPVIVSQALSSEGGISINTALRLDVFNSVYTEIGETITSHSYLSKTRALVTKMPGFFFSSYRQTARRSPVLLRMDHYEKTVREAFAASSTGGEGGVVESGMDIENPTPKQKLLIKFLPGTSRDQREDVVSGLRNFYDSDYVVIFDAIELESQMSDAVELLNFFFQVVGSIGILLCFFILLVSFHRNVRQNAWEFGVLRAVGLSGKQAVLVYVYEAVSLVLASIILGTFVGVSLAISLTLQMNLFTELPFRFEFPILLFVSMALMSLSVAVVGSVIPAKSILRQSIAKTLKDSQ